MPRSVKDKLSAADLSSAQVQDARLAGVEMRGTQVHAADFLNALGLTKKQTEEADADDQTRFPSYLFRRQRLTLVNAGVHSGARLHCEQ